MKLRLPPRFIGARLDMLDPHVFGQIIDPYAEKLVTNVKAGSGICLCGPAGVGKTFALAALTRYFAETAEVEGRRTWDYEFVTAPTFFENIGVAGDFENHDVYRNQPWMVTYSKVKWLVLNDLGKEYRGGKLESQVAFKLGRILRARNEFCLPTHITTNLAPKDAEDSITSIYGESIASLLREMCRFYVVDGEDRRVRSVAPKGKQKEKRPSL